MEYDGDLRIKNFKKRLEFVVVQTQMKALVMRKL